MRHASSAGGRLVALLGGLLLTVVASIAIPKLAIEGMLDVKAQPVLVGAMVVVLVVGAVLTVVRVVGANVVVETSPLAVTVRRGLGQPRSWNRHGTGFAGVVGKGQNGTTTRTLVVTTATERVEVECTWFGDRRFRALMDDVAPQQVGSPTR